MTHNATFRQLHTHATPLLLVNAWDAASAILFQQQGASAVATSSAALAWSLGYADGNKLPRQELLAAIRRIVRVLEVPLTVDMEDGYGDSPAEVAALVAEVAACGVAGINLEDGMQSPALLCEKIRAIRQALVGTDLFINARTDVFLANLAQGSEATRITIERLQQYRQAGADGGFVPGLCEQQAIREISAAIGMPLNIMTVPNMPPIDELSAAGVQRISVGPALFNSSYEHARLLADGFLHRQQVAALFERGLSYDEMNGLFPVAAQ